MGSCSNCCHDIGSEPDDADDGVECECDCHVEECAYGPESSLMPW
ncbi:MAG: hypothetical protein PHS14_21275 [Elusimicrobia bacterium]|nr:hypothetical protein [Elusimicrobiota bacterium]